MDDFKIKHLRTDFVHDGIRRIWGWLFPRDTPRKAGISLMDRRASFPTFKPQGYLVGRDPECDLVVNNPYVSNRHCLIYRVIRNDQVCVFLRDLSSNGTLVNQDVVGCNKVVELHDEDEITIVDGARFQFRWAGPIHRNIADYYSLQELLKKGHLRQVFACQGKLTGKRFAVKKHSFVPLSEAAQVLENSIEAELNLMGLCHRNIMFMKEAFEDDTSSFHITQIAEKGDLLDLIMQKTTLSENKTRNIFKQLFEAVQYLHDRNIVHRDLKPENILIVDESNRVLLSSFDKSITITSEGFDTTLTGSPHYVAPEILAASQYRKYGREVDIWSLGVVLYICLCGSPPFSDELYSNDFPYTLNQQIMSGRFGYPSPYWDIVGDPALDLVNNMLVVDPERRFSIEQCLAHPWLTQAAPGREAFAKLAPMLRRKPTMLESGRIGPPLTYMASSKELQSPQPGQSAPDLMKSMSETKEKGKLSPLIKGTGIKKQDHSMYQKIYDEPQRHSSNTKMTADTGDNIKNSNPDKRSFEESSQVIFSKALEKANTAVQLDNALDFLRARLAYREACDLINEVIVRTKGHEDKKKLEVIGKSYASRLEALPDMLAAKEKDGKTLPERQKLAAMIPKHDPNPSAVKPNMKEHMKSELSETSPSRICADPAPSLEYDPFAWLVNSVMDNSVPPRTPSTQLSEDLQNDFEFNNRAQEISTWTCTPSAHVPSDEIPLRLDSHPVVLPVEFKYPLTGMFSPPPDPHPLFISPSVQLQEEDINHIFSTFPACLGFYLLLNGFLQVIMPDDFDYEEGIPSFPSEFGGLKVSLIPETIFPTAGEASVSSPTTTTTSTRTRFERMFGHSSAHSSLADPIDPPSTNAGAILVGSTIRAIVPGSKSKQRFEGKCGVAITPRDEISKKYITVPTHLLTDAVMASKTMDLESDTWRKEVKLCVASSSIELGEVKAVFDQDPKAFPIGFSHDISLVDISNIPDGPRTIPYATDLTWLSQQEWMNIKYNSSSLVLLDDRSREAKSIGVVDSRCQMVGQGIFRIQQQSRKRSSFLGSLSSGSSSSRAQDPRDDPSTWTTLVARSILYRVQPDYPARGGQSGVPVCVVSESTDGTTPRSVKVAGFASFVQMVSDVQKYDLEGDKLYKRLQEGRVAFYGAFQVPQELREGYQIL